MNCQNCIRGGYDYCLVRTFPDNTTHLDYRNCSSWAITPELNSVSSVEERNRWICSGAFEDKLQALASLCAPEIDYNRDVDTCGPYMIDLTYPNAIFTAQLKNLPLYQACTYRVHTTCGFPMVKFVASRTTQDEYDIAYNTIDNLTISDEGIYNINATSQQGGSMHLNYTAFSNKDVAVQQVFKGVNKTDLVNLFQNCNGSDRNLYLTVTRVKIDAASLKSELSEEARVMQGVNVNDGLSLVFTNFPGDPKPKPSGGIQSVALSLLAVLALAFAALF